MGLWCLAALGCGADEIPSLPDGGPDLPTVDVGPDGDGDGLGDITPTDTADVIEDADVDADADAAEIANPDMGDAEVIGPPDGGDVDAIDPEDGVDTVDPADADTGGAMGTAPLPGELIITEIMADPSGISDSVGEWFEIHNLAATEVDLAHCTIHDDGIDSYPLADTWPTLPMEAGAYWVLGTNGDPAQNGSVEVDVVYGEIFLSNQSDEIRISCGGVLIDEVVYDKEWPLDPGASMSFDAAAPQDTTANDEMAHWCAATTLYTVGNAGTPGAANEACPVPDTEVDSCLLLSPAAIAAIVGDPVPFIGLIYDEGDTDWTTGSDPIEGLRAQAGWGQAADAPESWTWTDAVASDGWLDDEFPGHDQYEVFVEAPTPGAYAAAFRFSMDDGATWTLCDLDGSENGFDVVAAGSLTSAENPCDTDPCAVGPAPSCDGDVLTTTLSPGTCSLDGITAVCTYDEVVDDCALTAGVCLDGACVGGATAPQAGDLVITEIMINPDAVSDANGEWFEVLNASDDLLNLDGCVLGGANDSPLTIDAGGALLAEPGTYLLFVRNPVEAENGGLTGVFDFSGIALGNGSDALSIQCDGVMIDEVAWDDGATFPDTKGVSMQLDTESLDATVNDDGEAWCDALTPYGDGGDLGTPGAANHACDPCIDLVCETPPPPLCEGPLMTSFDPAGYCVDGFCNYAQNATIDCTETGDTCVAGTCVTPCDLLCELSANICVGGLEVDYGGETCDEACAGWPVGAAGDLAVNTTWCRIGYLDQGENVVLATACAAAALDGGGICVDPPTACEIYCEQAAAVCQNDQEIVFGESDCPTTCGLWDEGEEDDLLEDTVWCRINHLALVSEDPALHCSAASPDGGETCIDHCADVVCDAIPEAFCDGEVAMTYGAGLCDEGLCDYAEASVDCAASEMVCVAGVCEVPPTVCEQYCSAVAATCVGGNAIDFGAAGCTATCEAWPAGDVNDLANGTAWCRLNHLWSNGALPEEACLAAGIDGGGVCVTTIVDLVLNEIDYDQPDADTTEFVEIFNPTGDEAKLEDYTFIAINGALGEIHTELHLGGPGDVLPAGGYLVVGVAAVLDLLPGGVVGVVAEVDFVQNAGNGGDAVALLHNDGPVVDMVSYGGAVTDWTEGSQGANSDPGDGVIARCPNGADTNSNQNDFLILLTTTPGAANACPPEGP
jgi:hypothetical protein